MNKHNSQRIIIFITIFLCFIMIILATIGAVALKKNIVHFTFGKQNLVPQLPQTEEPSEAFSNPFDMPEMDPPRDDGQQNEEHQESDWEKALTQYEEKDNPFLKDDFVSHMGTNHKNYRKQDFQGKYYEKICDCIDDTVNYEITRKYYRYVSEETGTQIHVSCVCLKGDIPNLDILNQTIYEKTLFLAQIYLENYESSQITDSVNILVDSYVTYNDNHKLSIVLDEYYLVDQKVNIDLYCINADLHSGMILNNAKMIDCNEQFVKEFKERCLKQNGQSDAIAMMEPEDILALMKDEYNAVIFYTPMGMEVGMNYVLNGSSGWVTVTYTDYEKYKERL